MCEARHVLSEQLAELEAKHASNPEDATRDERGVSVNTCVGIALTLEVMWSSRWCFDARASNCFGSLRRHPKNTRGQRPIDWCGGVVVPLSLDRGACCVG